MTSGPDLQVLLRRIQRLRAERGGERVLIGIAGAPGSGKTTLARALVAALCAGDAQAAEHPGIAANVPMDGFHLADEQLRRLNRMQRKGAPDTFDPDGYLALLRRLRRASQTVWAPGFDRELDQPIAGSIAVEREVQVVVTEGNYLLLPEQPWVQLRDVLDEIWFLDLDPELRIQRLTARHIEFGKAPDAARAWAAGPDQRNADLVQAGKAAADLIL